jgi:hypothetical protein
MNTSAINVLFVLARNRMNRANKCALRCRITFLKKRKEFSTGLFINPAYWDGKRQRVKPNNQSEYLNSQLSLINQNLNQAFLFLQVKGAPFTVMDIYKQYKGETPKDEVGVMEEYSGWTLFK